jgi:hypothetical protein
MLTEKQINHINKYYELLSLKVKKLNKIEHKLKKIRNENENLYNKTYSNYLDDEMELITKELTYMQRISDNYLKFRELLNDRVKYKNEISYLKQEYIQYIIENNIDFENRFMDEDEYNILHGLNFDFENRCITELY